MVVVLESCHITYRMVRVAVLCMALVLLFATSTFATLQVMAQDPKDQVKDLEQDQGAQVKDQMKDQGAQMKNPEKDQESDQETSWKDCDQIL